MKDDVCCCDKPAHSRGITKHRNFLKFKLNRDATIFIMFTPYLLFLLVYIHVGIRVMAIFDECGSHLWHRIGVATDCDRKVSDIF